MVRSENVIASPQHRYRHKPPVTRSSFYILPKTSQSAFARRTIKLKLHWFAEGRREWKGHWAPGHVGGHAICSYVHMACQGFATSTLPPLSARHCTGVHTHSTTSVSGNTNWSSFNSRKDIEDNVFREN